MFLDESGRLLFPYLPEWMQKEITKYVPKNILLVYPFITLDNISNKQIVVGRNANYTHPIVIVTPQEVRIIQYDYNYGIKTMYFPFEDFRYASAIQGYECTIYYDDKMLEIYYNHMLGRFQYDQSFCSRFNNSEITYWDNEIFGSQLGYPACPADAYIVNKMIDPVNYYAYSPSKQRLYRYSGQGVLRKVTKNVDLLLIAPDNSILYQSTRSGNYYIFCCQTKFFKRYKVANPMLNIVQIKSARNI